MSVELGHRHVKRCSNALNLLGLRLGVAQFDSAETSGINLGIGGEILLVYAAQLSPVPNALTCSQVHATRLHREQSAVNYDCAVSN